MQIRNKSVAILCLAIGCTANAQSDDLPGCWKLIQITDHFANGSTQDRKPLQCYRFISSEEMISSCAEAYQRTTKKYKITKPGSFQSYMAQFENYKDQNDFKVEGDVLISAQKYAPKANTPPEKMTVEVVSQWIRMQKNTVDLCLPPPVVTTKEDYARYFRIKDLIISDVESQIQRSVLNKFYENLAGKYQSEISLQETDLKDVIEELDRINVKAKRMVRKVIESDYKRIEQMFFSPKNFDANITVEYASKDRQKWASSAAQEIIEANKLNGYLQVISKLDQRRIQNLELSEIQVNKNIGLGSEFLLQRELIYAFADNPTLSVLVQDKQDLKQLKELSDLNLEVAKKKYYYAEYGLERSIQSVTESLWSANQDAYFPTDVRKEAEERIHILRNKVIALIQAKTAITHEVGDYRINSKRDPSYTLFSNDQSNYQFEASTAWTDSCRDLSYNKSKILRVTGFRLGGTTSIGTAPARGYESIFDFYASFDSRVHHATSIVESVQAEILAQKLPIFFEFKSQEGGWKQSAYDPEANKLVTRNIDKSTASHELLFEQAVTGYEKNFKIFGVTMKVKDIANNEVVAENTNLAKDLYNGFHNRYSLIPSSSRCSYPEENNYVGAWLTSLIMERNPRRNTPYDGFDDRNPIKPEDVRWAYRCRPPSSENGFKGYDENTKGQVVAINERAKTIEIERYSPPSKSRLPNITAHVPSGIGYTLQGGELGLDEIPIGEAASVWYENCRRIGGQTPVAAMLMINNWAPGSKIPREKWKQKKIPGDGVK